MKEEKTETDCEGKTERKKTLRNLTKKSELDSSYLLIVNLYGIHKCTR